jgi:type II secretory ATPase GspE/PulE/Tfp pilus assembly ATPase PilB-like protein
MSDNKFNTSIALIPPTPSPSDEVLERVKKFSGLLPRRKALELNAVVTDNPRLGRYTVLLLRDRYEIKREVAVALGTNSYNIHYYSDEPMLFDVYFRAAYPDNAPSVGEEIAKRGSGSANSGTVGGGGERAELPYDLVDNWMDSTGRVHLTDTAKLKEYEAKNPSELVALEFAHLLLWKAIQTSASDVYIQAGLKTGRISFLLDDAKQEIYNNLQLSFFFDVCRCLSGAMGSDKAEYMEKINIDTSIPVRAIVKGVEKDFEFRLHSHPEAKGVSLVLRSQSELINDFEKTGLEKFQIAAVKKGVRSSNGMVLLTGVTGSGKTGTLECCYYWIHHTLRTRHLIEIVDTVEVISDWRDQIIVKEGLYSWDEAFKACLRSKPHKIGFGEIRSAEATEKAVEAAMTGHLMMATYHATSVGRTIDRLRQMGVDIQRLAASLNVIQSQVLVNKLCPNPKCRRVDEELSKKWNRVVYKAGEGCLTCIRANAVYSDDDQDSEIGYKGRTVIAETLTLDEEIEDMIIGDVPVSEILAYAVKEGLYVPFAITARMKIWNGLTSLREIETKVGKPFNRFYGLDQWENTAYFEGARNYQEWVAENLGKDDVDVLERAVKLRELARRGIGGERGAAKSGYDSHLSKHKLTEDDVDKYARTKDNVQKARVVV